MSDLLQFALETLRFLGAGNQALTVWGPLISSQAWVNTLVALGAMALLAVVAGIAVGSLSSLLVASLVLYLLLTDVFGLSLEFVPA